MGPQRVANAGRVLTSSIRNLIYGYKSLVFVDFSGVQYDAGVSKSLLNLTASSLEGALHSLTKRWPRS